MFFKKVGQYLFAAGVTLLIWMVLPIVTLLSFWAGEKYGKVLPSMPTMIAWIIVLGLVFCFIGFFLQLVSKNKNGQSQ